MPDSVHANVAEYREFAARTAKLPSKIRSGVRKRLRDVARPIGLQVLAEGAKALPGRLAEHVVAKARTPVLSQTATGARIVLGSKKGPQLGRMDAGQNRHPTYGHAPWKEQPVPAGSFSEEFQRNADEAREAVRREMNTILEGLD